jgi:NADPH:quinone reductase-like Zn-dependent oxidoreductase
MKGIVIHQFGKPEVLVYQEINKPSISSHEVLVKVQAAAINPKDCLVRKGKYKLLSGSRFPMALGEDLAGFIIEVGSAVKGFKIGDEVYGMINGWKVGSYAELAKIKASEIALKPKNINFIEAAAVPLAAMTALQAIRDLGKLQDKQKIFINGCSGGVGVFAIQIAKALGATVHGACSEANFELCRELGADKLVDYKTQNILETEERYDVFFDSFGNQNFEKVKTILSAKGIYVTTIPTAQIIKQTFSTYFSAQKAKLVVVKSNTKDLNYLKDLIEQGKIKSVVDKVYPLTEVQEAHAYVETKRAKGKVVLEIEKRG